MKKTLISAALIASALKLAFMAGADDGIEHIAKALGSDRALISATIDLELGGALEAAADEPTETPETSPESTVYAAEVLTKGKGQEKQQEQAGNQGEAQASQTTAVTISGEPDIRNDTSLDIDIGALLSDPLTLSLDADGPQILIIHTHGSEAYTQSAGDIYEESDPYRTQDNTHNVIALGDRLELVLEKYGLNVIHDTGVYDYPSYTGSYSRSGAAVEDYLEQYPGIEIVIDLHRDAIGDGETVYKTRAEIDGEECAQVMLLVGTGENGLYHPFWQDNLRLALAMQSAMDNAYPTLARPLAIKSERYNQHLTHGSVILEVGSTGNTLDQALKAVELFGNAVGPVLAELVE